MKNSDEMVNSLLMRKEQYDAEQKRKKNILTRAAVSACCVCLVSLLGVGLSLGGAFNRSAPNADEGQDNVHAAGENRETFVGNFWVNEQPDKDLHEDLNDDRSAESTPPASEDSESSGGNTEPYYPNTMTDDKIGVVIVDGITYVQFAVVAEAEKYTIDTCLGSAADYEGTYHSMTDVTGKLYTVKEDPNILIVELSNGGTVALINESLRNSK